MSPTAKNKMKIKNPAIGIIFFKHVLRESSLMNLFKKLKVTLYLCCYLETNLSPVFNVVTWFRLLKEF